MKKLMDIVSSVLVVAAIILGSYMILLKLTGHSPTLSQVNTTIIFVLLGLSLRTQYKLGKLTAFIEHHQEDIKELKQDFKGLRNEVKNDFKSLKQEFNQDFKELNKKIDKIILKTNVQ